jgi:hypothetical protein
LCDAVGEAFAHVVDEKVRVKIRRLIGKRSVRACRCCTPREYPTLINVSSAINVSSPGAVLTPCHASTIAQTAKQRLTKSAMRRGLNYCLLSRSREVSIGLTLNRTDTAGRAERVGLRPPRAH